MWGIYHISLTDTGSQWKLPEKKLAIILRINKLRRRNKEMWEKVYAKPCDWNEQADPRVSRSI